jgi:hypothetical protein
MKYINFPGLKEKVMLIEVRVNCYIMNTKKD